MSERDIERYREVTERLLRGGMRDAEVDRLVDQQEAIVRRLRASGAVVRELARRPWITVRWVEVV